MPPDELAKWFKPTTANEQILHDAIVSLMADIEMAKANLKQVVDDLTELC